jgi:hypothetical protein
MKNRNFSFGGLRVKPAMTTTRTMTTVVALIALILNSPFSILHLNAQTVYPNFATLTDFGGAAVANISTFVPNAGDYTLEVQATAGVPVNVAFAGISYTPQNTGAVRFIQQNGSIYVFENGAVAQLTATPPQPQYSVSGSNLIQNPSFENGTLFDGSTDRWIPDSWETWNGGSATWGMDVGSTNVRDNATYRSDGTKSLIMHSSSRYLMQQLPAGALEAGAYYLLTYDYWTSEGTGNGGITYQVMFGSDRCFDDILALRGHTTIETGTAQFSFSSLFQAPATVPSTVWFSLYRNVDKVDWLDNFRLVKIVPAAQGITGTSQATYLAGVAYAPENISLTGGDYIDMTARIVNPNFDNDFTGWNTVTGYKISTTEKASGLIAGSQNHAQVWVGSGGVSGNFYQTIANLPNGKYTVSAVVVPSFSGTLKLYAGSGTTNITSGGNATYSATGVVFDGTLDIGLQFALTGSPTVDFDSFTLKYFGVDADSYLQILNQKINEAKADTLVIYSSTTAPGYSNIAQYRAALAQANALPDSTVETLVAALNALQDAMNEYDAITAAYAPLRTAINALQTQVNTSGYPDQTEFTAVITAAWAVYNSAADERANIAATLADIAAKAAILTEYKTLGDAIADANALIAATHYPGETTFLADIAAAQAIYTQPAGEDLAAAIAALTTARGVYYNSQYTQPAVTQTVSWVDTSLSGSEKFVLRVDGQPFYMTNIQVRLDKLYGYNGWNDAELKAVLQRAANDGFNTVSIPLFWREVEPVKNQFDWQILDKYLGWCKEFGLKMEVLWFSWSSGGRVQYLWDYNGRQELRTPDYVCSMSGTSEFNVLRGEWEYSLDWRDTNLRDRDAYVLGQIMEHIALWDANNDSPHTVIGVQLGNEARAHGNNTATAAEIINYYSTVGYAVKNSKYKVWTRLNCVSYETSGRISANESKRNSGGTGIDFVGIDIYGTSASSIKGNMNSQLPQTGKNYAMIMEIDAKDSNVPIYQLAALAGNKAFDYYNMGFVDGNGLYSNSGHTLVERDHIGEVRQRNKMLSLANQDVALKAQGSSLYVYNYAGSSTSVETGLENITFTPGAARTQAVAVRRSASEIILMATASGTFILPAEIAFASASVGHFDENNIWIDEGAATFVTNTAGRTQFSIAGAERAIRIVQQVTVANAIQNPSFENGISAVNGVNVPAAWSLESTMSGTIDTKLSTATPADGTYSYNIWASQINAIDLYQSIVLPAGTYTLKASLHTGSAAELTTQHIYVQVGAGSRQNSATLTYSDSEYWQELSVTFTVTSDYETVRIGAASTGSGTTAGWFKIDNFRLTADTPDALDAVRTENSPPLRNDIFTIDGRYLGTGTPESLHLKRGVYIIGGKKKLVKRE